jgi:signal transduction histidine kinase
MGAGMMMFQHLRLADADGLLVYDSWNSRPFGTLTRDEIAQASALKSGWQTVGYLLAEGGMSGYSDSDQTYLLNRISRAALVAGLIAGGVALLLALALTYSLMRPVREMTTAASRLGEGDLSQRVQVRGSDELAILGQAFNHMADSLQQSQESRRAMTADIAHELRTPLAVQRAHLEALQDGVYPLDTDNLAPILEQNMLLTRLVDDLRTLALADAGQLKLEHIPTDLAALLASMLERFRPQADARQVQLHLALPGQPLAPALVDPQRIEQIIGNLLSNALRYTPEGGQVWVSLEQQGQNACVRVRDSGPGIPPEALSHVFERFYRSDRSRSRAEGGTGLGLAIARQLAEAHGGALQAANHPEGGAEFSLRLPLEGTPG